MEPPTDGFRYRVEMNKYIYCLFARMNEERLQKMNMLATNLMHSVRSIDIRANIEDFVMQQRSQQNIPKIVLV